MVKVKKQLMAINQYHDTLQAKYGSRLLPSHLRAMDVPLFWLMKNELTSMHPIL
jgi:hypothetical protein